MRKVLVWAYTNDAPSLMAGVETYIACLLKDLHALGINTRVVCTPGTRSRLLAQGVQQIDNWQDIKNEVLDRTYGSNRKQISRLLTAVKRSISRKLGTQSPRRRLRELGLRETNHVLFYCTYGSYAEIPLDASAAGFEVVSAIHDLLALRRPTPGFANRALQFRERTLLRELAKSSDAILVPSEIEKDTLKSQFSPTAPIYTSFCIPVEDSDGLTALRPIHLPDNLASFFYYPSGCVPWKNHLQLVRAVALTPQAKRIPVVLTGPDWNSTYGRRVQAEIRASGLQLQVLHLGFVSEQEKKWLFREALATLYLGDGEAGFAIPIWEAQSVGCPTLVADSSVLREQCGSSVLYCNPGNPSDIAAKMQIIKVSSTVREQLVETGAQRLRNQRGNLLPREVADKLLESRTLRSCAIR